MSRGLRPLRGLATSPDGSVMLRGARRTRLRSARSANRLPHAAWRGVRARPYAKRHDVGICSESAARGAHGYARLFAQGSAFLGVMA